MKQLSLFKEEKTMNETNEIFEFYVAGLKFRKEAYEEVKDLIEVGTQFQLIPEPENPYDPNAVKVAFGPSAVSHHLGYVPQKEEFSARVAALMAVHDYADCTVIEHNLDKEALWVRLKCKIEFSDKE